MKLTDKINFRQPKYMLPLIVYLPVIGTAYFVFDMFDTKIEDKPAANQTFLKLRLREVTALEAATKVWSNHTVRLKTIVL